MSGWGLSEARSRGGDLLRRARPDRALAVGCCGPEGLRGSEINAEAVDSIGELINKGRALLHDLLCNLTQEALLVELLPKGDARGELAEAQFRLIIFR